MIRPRDEQELAEAIRGATGALCIRGGGTRPIGRCDAETVLDMSGMAGIVSYDPGALTMIALAGTSVSEIENALAAEGQMLAFEPMDHSWLLGTRGVPTLGGVVAGNVSGPRRFQAGACRDFMLGVRFVDGRGDVIQNGGQVMKNVTGYDLVKLLCGSWGTLGVLAELSFKVLPRPETTATAIWHGLDLGAALDVFTRALSSPYEVSGAARAVIEGNPTPATVLRLEGFEHSVKYRVEQLTRLIPGADLTLWGQDENQRLWQSIRDVESLAHKGGNLWKSNIRPSDLVALQAAGASAQVIDWGGGLIWSRIDPSVDLRAKNTHLGGHHMLVQGQGYPTFHLEPSPLARIAAGIRAQFDPRGILNLGLMG